MNPYSCRREEELLAALSQGCWPDACDPELRAHAAACSRCAEVAFIAGTLRIARTNTVNSRPQASPGALWWKAQLRREYRAFHQVNQPISIVERLGVCCMLAAAAGIAAWQAALTIGAAAGNLETVLVIAPIGTLGLLAAFVVYLLADK